MRFPVSAHRGIVGACTVTLLAVVAPGLAHAQARDSATTVVVTITDSNLAVAPIYVPAGAVVFRIANKGKVARDFKVGGKRTRAIVPGGSAVLRLDITTEKNYPYYSVGLGHARLSGIIVAVPSPCSKLVTSTINVEVAEAPFKLSETRVPCGTVRFVVKNVGTKAHTFAIQDTDSPTIVQGGLTPRLQPGDTATVTVHFGMKGRAFYYCHETGHDDNYGQRGFLFVT